MDTHKEAKGDANKEGGPQGGPEVSTGQGSDGKKPLMQPFILANPLPKLGDFDAHKKFMQQTLVGGGPSGGDAS